MLENLEIVTCSYGPDLKRCARLCESIDQFVPSLTRHTLVVPARDLKIFKRLEGSGRRVLAVQDVLSARFHQLPRQDQWWIDHYGWPTRGLALQQIVKLSATEITEREYLIFADSDLRFIRHFRSDEFFQGGKLRLHRVPDSQPDGVQLKWHKRAGKLLGLARGCQDNEYAGQLVSWRRSNLAAMQQHIECSTGKPWVRAVSHSLRFSEHALYGLFVEKILGDIVSGHFYTNKDLCHCCRLRGEANALRSGIDSPKASALALLIQSGLDLSPNYEQAVHDAALSYVLCHA